VGHDNVTSQYRKWRSDGQRKSSAKPGEKPTLGKSRGRAFSGQSVLNLYNLLSGIHGRVLGKSSRMKFLSGVLLAAAFVLASSLAVATGNESGPEITVAAAADLSAALQEVTADYEKQTGTKVRLSFGSSGALTQQIENGAPFDVFFSADMDYPRQLITHDAADAGSLYRYAVGKLVLWVPADSPLDVEHKGLNVLINPSVKKISIANPQHAPYGRAAVAALKHAGIYDRVADRLVMGENVSQAAQFVESGNAQVGFVALSHAIAPAMQGKGKYWQIPQEAYPALDQGVVILSHSGHKKDAADFLEYIKTKNVVAVLQRYGFTVPEQKQGK
jgi:molybdate transport system substrate-binding protein